MLCYKSNTVSIALAYPATSFSSLDSKDLISSFDSKRSISLSDSLLPSIRVNDPILSIVATLLNAESWSGESDSWARYAPLNSSISLMSLRSSGIIFRDTDLIELLSIPKYTSNHN